jgi:hypothetical protein
MWWPTICPTLPGVHFGLGIAYEPDLVSEEAKKFAAAADVVVVAAGFNPHRGRGLRPHLSSCPGARTR